MTLRRSRDLPGAPAAEAPDLTVIIPAHNPDLGRLRETLLGLRAQTLPADGWETLLVDNASASFPGTAWLADCAPPNIAVIQEAGLGLSAARRRGFRAAAGNYAVLVDDDNVLAPDYLEQALRLFADHPRVGVAGGRSEPRFETDPPAWTREFFPLLALRDLGGEKISTGLRPPGAARNRYPDFAPIGAGMALRRAAWTAWLDAPASGLTDRRGGDLSSSGDNDLVLRAMAAGWEVGYFPQLGLTHLIPSSRLAPDYLARLNRGIQKSWMQVLTRHEANPWPPLTASAAALRRIKAWFAYRAWSSPAARVRWSGACGHFEGRISGGA
jgi:cellulose synthase/poly-beta-1,6-N-acetylglucosamine synthase-like glycosyltransferase